jgi:hypothetical protein
LVLLQVRAVTMMAMPSSKRWWIERLARRPVVRHDEPLGALRSWPVSLVSVLVVVVGGVLAMWLLGVWTPIPTQVPMPEQLQLDRLRLDRIKTGLTVAAGLAAGVTLLVALRRQALSERAQRFAESDALEQRTTALYVAAAEQLGSDKAAVRLAGLYALERLGQDNPKLRQTVFDVWCAYLRMPYTPPVDVLRRNTKAISPYRWRRQRMCVRDWIIRRHTRRWPGRPAPATANAPTNKPAAPKHQGGTVGR